MNRIARAIALILASTLTMPCALAANHDLLIAATGQSAGTEGAAGSSGQSGTPPGVLRQQQTERENAGRRPDRSATAAAASAGASGASAKK
jgi:hypothetical protein